MSFSELNTLAVLSMIDLPEYKWVVSYSVIKESTWLAHLFHVALGSMRYAWSTLLVFV